MKKIARYCLITMLVTTMVPEVSGQRIIFTDPWSEAGVKVRSATTEAVSVDYSIEEVSLEEVDVDGQKMRNISLPGSFLFNDIGCPNLPGNGRYIAVPQGATPKLKIMASRVETFQGLDIVPAPRIPKETETGPAEFAMNPQIYTKNEFYPAQPVTLSTVTSIRGIDVVLLGITPFQYNPVTKELKIFRDLKVEVVFEGGNGHFGEDRLRSRFWDPILEDALLNYTSLPVIDYDERIREVTDIPGYEYLIITPNGASYTQWADSIRRFRIQQGISTVVKTLSEIGGNTTAAIKSYINTAYNTWNPAPAAVLLLGDFGNDPANSVVSPVYNNYCVSDNIYGDVTNDHLPDVCMARITAANASQLQVMVTKFLDYERNPPVSAGFYQHPVTALGWQTQRWYQICAEATGGYWKYVRGKDPIRINEIYSGLPGSLWSTAANTSAVTGYFGPGGQNYIPAQPNQMSCCWTGGNAAAINSAINAGTFCVLHRDHGNETGWGEPAYSNSDINGLTNVNNQLPFVFSINCLTGKFNSSNESFAEKFHRYTSNGQNSGALGLIAATEVSYSFVNDTYLWGMMDNFWPDFMPTYGTNPASRGFMPCFGNAAGKYFLQQSNWPCNPDDKTVTYHLFHYHGDAFSVVYSEVPQALTVNHASTIPAGATSFQVSADYGAFIALTAGSQILGTATGTGNPVTIPIPETLTPGQVMCVTITKQNYFRYTSNVTVVVNGSPIPNFNADPTSVCTGQSVDFTDLSTGTPTSWNWSFAGGNPGTSVLQNPQNIAYNVPGTYSVTLTVTNAVSSNSITRTGYIIVNDPAQTPVPPSGDTSLCVNNSNSLYTIPASIGATGYTWTLNPGNAGAVNSSDTSCIINWDPNWTGYASLRVMASNGCGASPYSPELVIHVNPSPSTPDQPSGPSVLCQGCEASTDYTIARVPYANQYFWEISPDNAGIITWTDTAATVTWSTGFTGTATIRVKVANLCTESNWSEPLDVSINTFPVGISEAEENLAVSVWPNPSNGRFRLAVKAPDAESFHLGIVNTLGSMVYDLPAIPTDGNYSAEIDVTNLHSGLYYLVITTPREKVTRKIVIQR